MAKTPKPVRKAGKVTTRSARTPDGKKVTYQTSKEYKSPVTGDGGKPPLDKSGKSDKQTWGLMGVKTNAQMKKAIKGGEFPAGVTGLNGKARAPISKYGKTSPSFKKKAGKK
jgi:hypothetical protein